MRSALSYLSFGAQRPTESLTGADTKQSTTHAARFGLLIVAAYGIISYYQSGGHFHRIAGLAAAVIFNRFELIYMEHEAWLTELLNHYLPVPPLLR